ncbi:hypothetical protein ABB37_06083 [Leptomonas pyrrhocoris]|uniref:RRM domain-containing protein n=1 Tax=Leptomonas pyrrhocoris TaxID=157538 RepID=A0A0M9FYG4_LEPPY|nr:hypothetical protein ABB37_06083 [Leptomonas pyrrhocoris]KPA78456.1 hypothetical protein ABB37_06083 [Leptomonas pyrrhocoris]|eukprot:XP_015656895.1 hypothetical protein ABB37_06083 [Leptomonas pyrrhocoris]
MSLMKHSFNGRVNTGTESRLNLLVRYLDHTVDDDQLRRYFAQFGDVTSSMVMRDILTGESRGFGFVRFVRPAEAMRAMAATDGKKIGGKAVNVLWAKQQHDMAPAGQERLRMNKLFLRNVPMDVSEQQLVSLVRHCGDVTEVSLHNDRISASCHAPSRRIAFIVFNTEGAAEAALHAVHNTCPFRSCHNIPLMAKLSEDYKAKNLAHNSSSSCSSTSPERYPETPAYALPVPLRRKSQDVISVPLIVKFAELNGCRVSTPNSTMARSPGISSLVPSLESTSLEMGAVASVRATSIVELENSGHLANLSLSTPMRHLSREARVYRHCPYSGTQIIPASMTMSCTSIYADSPVAQRPPHRV